MLPDKHPAVLAELDRRVALRAKSDNRAAAGGQEAPAAKKAVKAKTKAKDGAEDAGEAVDASGWEQKHQQLAEARVFVEFTALF